MYINAAAVLCYSYTYDMIFVTLFLKSNKLYMALRVNPRQQKNSGCAPVLDNTT
jgi:hypothetical protein